MKCTHPMTEVEIRICALTFGNCWVNPPVKIEAKSYSNKPSGHYTPDKNFNQ